MEGRYAPSRLVDGKMYRHDMPGYLDPADGKANGSLHHSCGEGFRSFDIESTPDFEVQCICQRTNQNVMIESADPVSLSPTARNLNSTPCATP